MNSKELLELAIERAIESGSFHVLNQIENTENFCIWGAGDFFLSSYERLFKKRGIKIQYIIDSNPNKQGNVIVDNILCISPQQLCELDNPIVLPFVYNGFKEICNFCNEKKIAWIHRSHFLLDMQDIESRDIKWFADQKNRIMQVFDLLEDEDSRFVYANAIYNRIARGHELTNYKKLYSTGEYFSPEGGFNLTDKEDFIDVGAFNGDTFSRFLDATHCQFDSAHLIEMSTKNYNQLLQNIKKNSSEIVDKVSCYNYGAWHEKSTIYCGDEEEHSGVACSINKGKGEFLKEEERELVCCDRLDTILKGKKVSLIKMDIEGAEVNALRGARDIIVSQHPKMSICIYHNLRDYWEVPLLLKEMVPSYKIIVRHHSKDNGNTVCYAY